jgi:Serine kinase of the HPr protein, regulates carbohydrate metabolism
MYRYKGFGAIIDSEIEFPELIEHNTNSSYDLRIVNGSMPNVSEGVKQETSRFLYVISGNSFLFEVKGVARYLSKDGNLIVVDVIDSSIESRTIRLHILATVMAAILLQRKRIPLHASSFFADDKLIMLSGDSGAGKSTLLAEFIKSGFRLFSDDINVLRIEDGTVLVSATYPMIKLWNEAVDLLDHSAFNDRSFRIKSDMEKFGFFFHDKFDFGEYSAAILVILKKSTESFFSSKLLLGSDAFMAVNRQVYRPFLIQSPESRILSFETISALTKQCKVLEVSRPEKCNPGKLMEFVLEKIENLKAIANEACESVL